MSDPISAARTEIRLVSLFRDVASAQERRGGLKAAVASRHRESFERKIRSLKKTIQPTRKNHVP